MSDWPTQSRARLSMKAGPPLQLLPVPGWVRQLGGPKQGHSPDVTGKFLCHLL